MTWRNLRWWFLPILLTGCTTQPYSKWQIHVAEDNLLQNADKIAIVTAENQGRSASTWSAIARYYALDERWDEALNAVNQAIKIDPLNSSFHSLKANYAFNSGNTSVAYAEALAAYKLGSRSLQQSLGLAKMAVALSELEIAGSIIDSLLVVYPDKPEVLYLAARKYDMHQNTPLARACYQKVASQEPENAENAFYYARFLLNQNDRTNALQVLQQAAGKANSLPYQQLLGDVYYLNQQYDSATRIYHRVLASRADTTVINKLIKVYYTMGPADSLLQVSRQAADLFPRNKRYLLLTARNLDRSRQYDLALNYYHKLYKLDTLDSLVAAEMSYLQRKIAYLQRQQQEQQQLADSLSKVLPATNF